MEGVVQLWDRLEFPSLELFKKPVAVTAEDMIQCCWSVSGLDELNDSN